MQRCLNCSLGAEAPALVTQMLLDTCCDTAGCWQLVPSSPHCLWQALLQSLRLLYQLLLVLSHTHPEKACFSDFQPVPSRFLPSSIASNHLTLLSIPLFTAANLELSFLQPKIYLDVKAEAPEVHFVFAAGLRQGLFLHGPFSRHRSLSPFSFLLLRPRFHGRP